MFHALPGDAIDEITMLLAEKARGNVPFNAGLRGLRSLGSGVAFDIGCPELEKVRGEIASAFDGRLTKQDCQTWRPHITVQNKASRESAGKLLASLQREFQPWPISVEGMELWRYDGGPWEFTAAFRFGMAGD